MSEQIITPAFVIDKAQLQSNIDGFGEALRRHWPNSIIGYSYKTNSLPWLLQYMREQGCYAEVVSGTEYELAEALGYADGIIYNGPVKEKKSFLRALLRDNVINLDSKRELVWLRECAAAGIRAKIGLRVNFDLEQNCPGETVAGEAGNRFGFCADNGELKAAIHALGELGITVSGLHMHVSTKTRSRNIYRALCQKAVELTGLYGLKLSYLDIGGGFFAGGDRNGAYEEYCSAIADELCPFFDRDKVTLIVEPGASLIASPVSYVTGVLDVKDTTKARFVTTDGSRLHLDPFLAKQSYSYRLENADSQRYGEQVICGYTCMEKDRFMTIREAQELREGSRIIYECVGSYTMCLNPLFIDYLPNVYVASAGRMELVREKWGVREYLQKSKGQMKE